MNDTDRAMMSVIDASITDTLIEKYTGWKIELVEKMPLTRELTETTFIGAFSWTQIGAKRRWLIRRHAIDIGQGIHVTPTDLARAYLKYKFGATYRKRCTTSQYKSCIGVHHQAPLYANPSRLDSAVYLDVKSAYWQILFTGGWNIEYNPQKWIGWGSPLNDFPYPDIKMARNALVSVSLAGSMRVWQDGQLKVWKRGNQYVNLIMWAYVQDVLNGIAWDMVHMAKAVYVNTDGYIVADEYLEHAYAVADLWGIHITPRHTGAAVVRGAGDYDIGTRLSGYRARLGHYPIDKINPHGGEWLRDKYRTQAARRGTIAYLTGR